MQFYSQEATAMADYPVSFQRYSIQTNMCVRVCIYLYLYLSLSLSLSLYLYVSISVAALYTDYFSLFFLYLISWQSFCIRTWRIASVFVMAACYVIARECIYCFTSPLVMDFWEVPNILLLQTRPQWITQCLHQFSQMQVYRWDGFLEVKLHWLT